jgi:DNA ligase-1
MKWRNPDGQIPAGSQKRPVSKKKAKKGGDGEDDEDDDDDDDGTKVKVEVLLATKWDLVTGSDPTGWWMSEKLDGVRYVSFCSLRMDLTHDRLACTGTVVRC